MITEIIHAAINEAAINMYEITEIQLGVEPMQIFIKECRCKSSIADLSSITSYTGIKIMPHHSRNAVMYSLKKQQRISLFTISNYVSDNNTIIEIKNWKELKEMFGLNDNDVKGLKGAKRLHKELKDKFISEKTLDNQAIDCSLKGEAVALFEIVDVKGNVIIYEYTGTAN